MSKIAHHEYREYKSPEPVFVKTYLHPRSVEEADKFIRQMIARLEDMDAEIIAAHMAGENDKGNALRADRRIVAENLKNIYQHKSILSKGKP